MVHVHSVTSEASSHSDQVCKGELCAHHTTAAQLHAGKSAGCPGTLEPREAVHMQRLHACCLSAIMLGSVQCLVKPLCKTVRQTPV